MMKRPRTEGGWEGDREGRGKGGREGRKEGGREGWVYRVASSREDNQSSQINQSAENIMTHSDKFDGWVERGRKGGREGRRARVRTGGNDAGLRRHPHIPVSMRGLDGHP